MNKYSQLEYSLHNSQTYPYRFYSSYYLTGLQHDDLYNETPDVKEALRRLPPKLYDERQFRIVRALHLSMQHDILPNEQWTKWEEDVKYLQPYLEEVIRERKEREAWDSQK